MLRAMLANSMMREYIYPSILTQLNHSSMCGEKFDLYHDIHMETLLLNTVVL
jgi:hypothetical protein